MPVPRKIERKGDGSWILSPLSNYYPFQVLPKHRVLTSKQCGTAERGARKSSRWSYDMKPEFNGLRSVLLAGAVLALATALGAQATAPIRARRMHLRSVRPRLNRSRYHSVGGDIPAAPSTKQPSAQPSSTTTNTGDSSPDTSSKKPAPGTTPVGGIYPRKMPIWRRLCRSAGNWSRSSRAASRTSARRQSGHRRSRVRQLVFHRHRNQDGQELRRRSREEF